MPSGLPPPSWNPWRELKWALKVSAEDGSFVTAVTDNTEVSNHPAGFVIDALGSLHAKGDISCEASTYGLKITAKAKRAGGTRMYPSSACRMLVANVKAAPPGAPRNLAACG